MSQQISQYDMSQTGRESHKVTRDVIRVVTHDQMAAVGRLRYRVYAEEMGRDEPNADHTARTVLDGIDASSTVLASFDSIGEAIGTVRYEFFEQLTDEDRNFHFLDTLPMELRERSSITTKLITHRSHRRGTLTNRLMLGIFVAAHEQCLGVNFINCNPPLDRFFTRFGFVAVGEPKTHSIYGMVRVMMVPMHDQVFLESIRSPFAAVLRKFSPDDHAAAATRQWSEAMGNRYWDTNC